MPYQTDPKPAPGETPHVYGGAHGGTPPDAGGAQRTSEAPLGGGAELARAKHEGAAHDAHAQDHRKTYFRIFAALMVLLVITVFAAFIPVPKGWHVLSTIIAMTIAVVKAMLVILYFMHVREQTRLTKIFVFAAFMWLAILFVFTLADYFTRHWTPTSEGWTMDERVVEP